MAATAASCEDLQTRDFQHNIARYLYLHPASLQIFFVLPLSSASISFATACYVHDILHNEQDMSRHVDRPSLFRNVASVETCSVGLRSEC